MKIIKQNIIKKKLINKLDYIISKLENTGNCNIITNGEKNFIDNLLKKYEKEEFVFFDVGANVGKYSQEISKTINSDNYRGHIFEPQKLCFEDLQNKFVNKKRIKLNNFGLSEKSEEQILYYNSKKDGMASLYKRNLDFYNIKMNNNEKIQLNRADIYINENKIEKINLLKIDVEGHEMKVLNGFGDFLNHKFIDYIQFEYGGTNLDSKTNLIDFYELLNKRGFEILRIMPKHLELSPYNPRIENFKYRNIIAISKDKIDL